MKKNDLAEIKKMDIQSVTARAKELKIAIGNLHFDKNMHKLANLKSVSNKRRELAQTLTILNQKILVRAMEALNGK